MAAPRKYSDAQRAALYALYEQGLTAAEIVARAKEGLTSVAPFEIPRRTASQIVSEMARERRRARPDRFAAIESEDVGRFPNRVLRLTEREMDRIERKEDRGLPLSPADMDRLEKVMRLTVRLDSYFRKTGRRVPSNGAKSGPLHKSLIDDLARQEEEAKGAEGNGSGETEGTARGNPRGTSHTHTHRRNGDAG